MTLKQKILLVDDDPSTLLRISEMIVSLGYEIIKADLGEKALDIFNVETDISTVLLDLRLPDISGMDVAKDMIEKKPEVPVILITAYGNVPDAVRAIKIGVYDFIDKPVSKEELKQLLHAAVSHNLELQELQRYKEESLSEYKMVGQSEAMQKVYYLIDKVAESDCNVLITGNTGVGKELVAHAIHNKSARKYKKIVKIDCSCMPETLIESELFGSERGSYTGSVGLRRGKLEIADRSTLFLDELGNLSMNVQAKLLHFLDSGIITRVGGIKDIKIDARIIAATNVDLEQEINDGKFRSDLYYRVKTVQIKVPDLKDRRGDIPLLLDYFIEYFSEKKGGAKPLFTPSAQQFLKTYEWPGNVRELKNLAEYTCSLYSGRLVDINDLRPTLQSQDNLDDIKPKNLREATLQFQREHILSVFKETEQNITQAARLLGVDRTNLYRKMRILGIR
ncbi:sigma-54-dependent Fis family transcriptional regulator [candidate division KSB1 bacterium]|nr:MAG: sigma-54-dependent Fis family transcriptional regulator [candidate division KSB1 bacterium]